MNVRKNDGDNVTVSINGSSNFQMPAEDLFNLTMGSSTNYFSNTLLQEASSIEIDMEFNGVTSVEFGPQNFDYTRGIGWFDNSTISDAIKNGNRDVSGYKFNPSPQIDFSEKGPFGFINAVAISNYPIITITLISKNCNSIVSDFQQQSAWGVSFLGNPLAVNGSHLYKSSSLTQNASKNSVAITLSPPKDLIAGTSLNSVGFILGVHTDYPAAK